MGARPPQKSKKMKKYPQLAEMGVVNPHHIEKYSVNSIGYTDVLRIVYERPKGSLLPQSKTYKFPRIQQSTKDDGAGQADVVMNSDPALKAAVSELQDILEANDSKLDLSAAIADEIRLLEEDIALRSERIRMLLGKIQG